MRALAIVHESDAGPGVFTDAILATGAELHCWRFPDDGPPWCDPRDYDAVLTFGGVMNPDQQDEHPWLAEEKALLADLLERGIPLLGVCLGAELLAEAAGAPARRASDPEIGWYEVQATDKARHDPLLAPLGPRFDALEWHGYELQLPPGATPLAHSDRCLQAYRVGDRAWGIQFHAEVVLADFERWLENHNGDAEALRAQTRARISSWNQLGRGLCARFLDAASGG